MLVQRPVVGRRSTRDEHAVITRYLNWRQRLCVLFSICSRIDNHRLALIALLEIGARVTPIEYPMTRSLFLAVLFSIFFSRARNRGDRPLLEKGELRLINELCRLAWIVGAASSYREFHFWHGQWLSRAVGSLARTSGSTKSIHRPVNGIAELSAPV